jgi:hypothetical protein
MVIEAEGFVHPINTAPPPPPAAPPPAPEPPPPPPPPIATINTFVVPEGYVCVVVEDVIVCFNVKLAGIPDGDETWSTGTELLGTGNTAIPILYYLHACDMKVNCCI